MCGRYVMAKAIGDLVAEAEAEADANLELRQSWNVAPTTDVPVVLERLIDDELHRQIHVARWGLVPGWAKELSVGVRAFNARSETASTKPTFRSAVKKRRAVVPVEGYYEWKKEGSKKRPFYVHREDEKLIFFAGLYEWWKDEDGSWILSTSIMTMDSPSAEEPGVLGELAGLHDRLPIPLGKEMMGRWMNPAEEDGEGLIEQIRAEAFDVASDWTMHEVDTAVGNVRNNSPELIEAHSNSLF
ncbi:SOS response-associated peptidase [Glutamicibacter sp.]|uniref:SOS response-associated peptidase n=1 Tax=Glutamicibacter sp. TaxID=1931995 RepID=UPI003D6A0340